MIHLYSALIARFQYSASEKNTYAWLTSIYKIRLFLKMLMPKKEEIARVENSTETPWGFGRLKCLQKSRSLGMSRLTPLHGSTGETWNLESKTWSRTDVLATIIQASITQNIRIISRAIIFWSIVSFRI